jgi:hypothetical protein
MTDDQVVEFLLKPAALLGEHDVRVERDQKADQQNRAQNPEGNVIAGFHG